MSILGREARASNLLRARSDEKPACGCLMIAKYKELGR